MLRSICSRSMIALLAVLAASFTESTAQAQWRAFPYMLQPGALGRTTVGEPVLCTNPGGFAHWASPNIPWYLNAGTQAPTLTPMLQGAMAAWNGVWPAAHSLSLAGTTNAQLATDNRNTILWGTDLGCSGDPVLGCRSLTVLVMGPNQQILEADILLRSDATWLAEPSRQGLQTVATIELGHALGIHSVVGDGWPFFTSGATMDPIAFSYFPDATYDLRTLEPADMDGLNCAHERYFAPAQPSQLLVYPAACLGWVSLDWPIAANASSYELQQATSSTFSNAFTVYAGPSTDFETNGSGTRYFRVRACNAYGCSAWRNGNTSAPYYPTCL